MINIITRECTYNHLYLCIWVCIINCVSLTYQTLRTWTIVGSLVIFIVFFWHGCNTQNFSGMTAQRRTIGVSSGGKRKWANLLNPATGYLVAGLKECVGLVPGRLPDLLRCGCLRWLTLALCPAEWVSHQLSFTVFSETTNKHCINKTKCTFPIFGPLDTLRLLWFSQSLGRCRV